MPGCCREARGAALCSRRLGPEPCCCLVWSSPGRRSGGGARAGQAVLCCRAGRQRRGRAGGGAREGARGEVGTVRRGRLSPAPCWSVPVPREAEDGSGAVCCRTRREPLHAAVLPFRPALPRPSDGRGRLRCVVKVHYVRLALPAPQAVLRWGSAQERSSVCLRFSPFPPLLNKLFHYFSLGSRSRFTLRGDVGFRAL